MWKMKLMKRGYRELPCDPRRMILLRGVELKQIKTHVHTKTCILIFIAALFLIAKQWK